MFLAFSVFKVDLVFKIKNNLLALSRLATKREIRHSQGENLFIFIHKM